MHDSFSSYRQIFKEFQCIISRPVIIHRNRARKVDDLKMAWGTSTESKSFQKAILFPPQCCTILSQPASQNVLYHREIMSLCPYPSLSWERLIKYCSDQAWDRLFRVTWTNFIPDPLYVNSTFLFVWLNLNPNFGNNEYTVVSMYCL